MNSEYEHGSCVPRTPRRHNGYWAGDLSQTAPLPWARPQRRPWRKPVDPEPTTVSIAPTAPLRRAPSTASLTTVAH